VPDPLVGTATDPDPDVRQELTKTVIFERTDSMFSVVPCVADRAVVVRPVQPVYVQPGQRANLFVSSPIWFQVHAGPGTPIWDAPILRPSDTWFGASTREGEICYATRVHAQFDIETVAISAYRVLTPLGVRNTSGEVLHLVRVRFPVHHLSLFRDPEGPLWTEAVTITLEEAGKQANLEIIDGSPPQARNAELVAGPRVASRTNLIQRAMSMFFHQTRME
jgi:hypothetical protein